MQIPGSDIPGKEVRVKSIFFLLIMLLNCQTTYAWLDPGDADVDVVLNTEDNQFAFYSGPGSQTEWLLNNGARSTIRIKGYDDPSALQWDLSSFAGKKIDQAELHLCLYGSSIVHALVVSTINSDWHEGTKNGSTAGNGDSCWRWRSYPDGEWTYMGSDFSSASYGNFGTLVTFGYKHSDTFRQYSANGYQWVAMKLDPAIVYAMILDNPGLVVTDPRFGLENGNPSIYSSEQNSAVQPRLLLKTTASGDATPPGDITGFSVDPGEWNGEAILSFTAPTDTETVKAFGYDVRYATENNFSGATRVERWRIPRPGVPGSIDRLLIEDLVPGTTYYFWVSAYDNFGNTSSPVMTSLTLPAEIPPPILASGALPTPDPTGREIAGQDGVLHYWACSELAKVSPLTGSRIVDGYSEAGHDDYKKANVIWDAATNTITLRAVRNQVVGFQVIIERLLPALTGLSLQAADLLGPSGAMIEAADNLEFFKLHYTGGSTPYPDPAIPLSPPFASTFDIPSVSNPSGRYQSVWADLYVPRNAVPGTYTTPLVLDGDQLTAPITVNLQVVVSVPVIPDSPTFSLDLNGYGNKWSSEASRYQVFQLSHKHRMVPNTLPYGWSENWSTDRAPQLAGSGAGRHISDWTEFAGKYGPFFDGTAFSPDNPAYPYHGPGENTGIADFYTTGFEGWPISIADPTYGYDATAAGGMGHAYWNSLVDGGGVQTFWLEAPDVQTAFAPGFSEGTRNVWREFAQYARDHNWTTAFQFYLNNKRSYTGTNSLWTLEEQYVADDFRADAWFMRLCRQGWESAAAPEAHFQWRIDTSTRWQQNWGQLKGIANLRVQGDGKYWDYRHDRYRHYTEQQAEQRWWYGTGPGRTDTLTAHSAEILSHWSHGFDGGLPYWDSFQNNWTTATGSDGGGDATLSLLLSGADVPGHGAFDGRIATIRMKGMRYGQQLCELLNLLAQQNGWNRNLVSRALSNRYGNHAGIGYDSYGGDEYSGMNITDYYRLQSDLVATLEQSLFRGDVDGDGTIGLADVIVVLQVQSNSYNGPLRLAGDVNDDGRIGLQEAVFILAKMSENEQ